MECSLGSVFVDLLCIAMIIEMCLILLLLMCFIVSGMFAIRADREYVIEEDFLKAVRKIADNKKLETKLDYKPV